MEFLSRILAAIAALLRFVVHVVACLACGYLFGAITGGVFANNAEGGSRVGLGVAGFIALCTFPETFTPRSVADFVWWWLHGVLAVFVALALAVSVYFIQVDLALHSLKLEWDEFMVQLASGALALLVWLPTIVALLHILFSPAVREWVEERILSGGLSSAREVADRAKQLGASKPGRRP